MAKSLVIVESPSKAKTINKYLGKDFVVEASVGHIIDLPKTKIGVDIKNGFKPQYINIRGKKDVIEKLQKLAAKAENVYIATDPDREGEAIAWHIESVLKEAKANIFRVEFNEITRSAVEEAINSPRQIDMGRVNSQQARRILDRIVGYKVSPFLWKSIYRGLSAGRVQSVALRLVCEREQAISDFKPEEYWTVKGDFLADDNKQISTKLEKIGGKKVDIKNETDAKAHEAAINASSFSISALTKKATKRQPSPPFITSTMQQEAVRKLRMSSKRVMSTAQSLYEGVSIGKFGQVGLITYMRTDSVRISNDAMDAVRGLIPKLFGENNLPEKPRFFKTKKSAQDAHEAIRPTHIEAGYEPDAIKEFLNNDQYRLYKLIWSRFVASQMIPATIEKTTVEVSDSTYLFRVSGEVIKDKGFIAAYDNKVEDDESPANIPAGLAEGAAVSTKAILTEQHFTKPPARYTESTIIKELDELGIGRPSTYAQIITTLLDRKYVENTERKLAASEIGMMVNSILVQAFPDLINVEFTSNMEDQLDDIEGNTKTYEKVLETFYTPFEETLNKANERTKEIKASIQEKTDVKCDKCGSDMLVKWSRNGKFLACSAYPECKNTRPMDGDKVVSTEPVYSEHKCDKDGGRMVIKNGPYGQYLACENYPECKSTRPMPTGIACPTCETGEIFPRRSKRGRTFFGCSNYPKCNFVSWGPIENTACPSCKNNYMLKKITKKKGEYLLCPECKHEVLGAATAAE